MKVAYVLNKSIKIKKLNERDLRIDLYSEKVTFDYDKGLSIEFFPKKNKNSFH